jgi:hypothetical protein
MFMVTGYSIICRRQAIMQAPWGAWAAFTFPTISTVNAALLFWHRLDAESEVQPLLHMWVAVLSFVLLPAVLYVIGAFTFFAMFHPGRLTVSAVRNRAVPNSKKID